MGKTIEEVSEAISPAQVRDSWRAAWDAAANSTLNQSPAPTWKPGKAQTWADAAAGVPAPGSENLVYPRRFLVRNGIERVIMAIRSPGRPPNEHDDTMPERDIRPEDRATPEYRALKAAK